MPNRLPAVRALVDDDAISLPVALHARTDLRRRAEQPRFDARIGLLIEVREMFGVQCRHNQDMSRCLGTQIVKSDDLVVAQDFARRNLTAHDFAKDAVLLAHYFGCMSSKSSTLSGRGITPAIFDFMPNGTVVCTSGTAGA